MLLFCHWHVYHPNSTPSQVQVWILYFDVTVSFWPIAACQSTLDCPSLGLPTAILKWHRGGLADTRALELSQALFDVAGVFTNRFQRPTDIITHLWRAQLFDMQCQLHQGSFQGQLVGVHPLQHIRQ